MECRDETKVRGATTVTTENAILREIMARRTDRLSEVVTLLVVVLIMDKTNCSSL